MPRLYRVFRTLSQAESMEVAETMLAKSVSPFLLLMLKTDAEAERRG